MFSKTTEFDFEPTEQFEGKTVQAQCSVKKLFYGWVTNRDFKRLVSLHFDLSGGAAELGIYYIKENIRAVPLVSKTNPLVTDSVAVVVVVVVVFVVFFVCFVLFFVRTFYCKMYFIVIIAMRRCCILILKYRFYFQNINQI